MNISRALGLDALRGVAVVGLPGVGKTRHVVGPLLVVCAERGPVLAVDPFGGLSSYAKAARGGRGLVDVAVAGGGIAELLEIALVDAMRSAGIAVLRLAAGQAGAEALRLYASIRDLAAREADEAGAVVFEEGFCSFLSRAAVRDRRAAGHVVSISRFDRFASGWRAQGGDLDGFAAAFAAHVAFVAEVGDGTAIGGTALAHEFYERLALSREGGSRVLSTVAARRHGAGTAVVLPAEGPVRIVAFDG